MSLANMFKRILILICAASFAVAVSATTVTPIVIDLQTSGRGVVQNITVTNTGTAGLPIEITILELKPTASGFEPVAGGGNIDDLLVSPPSTLIPVGRTQSFRVQWVGEPDLTASKHYYVSINQLPVKLPEGQSAVQVVYNFQVLISVSAPSQKPQLMIVSAAPATVDGKAVAAVSVRNSGAAHGYISQHKLKIVETSAAGADLFAKTISGQEFQGIVGYGLVASGQTRTVNVPLDKPVPAGARITAVLIDERAQ